MTLQKT